MSIRFEDTGDPADEEALEELEARAGHALPVAYRDFLEAHDGAVPEANRLPDAASRTEVAVRTFLSAEEVLRTLDALGPDRVPTELLPISDDELGNGLWINTEDGTVWSYDHEDEDPAEEDLWAAFTREAEDLEELLDRLEPAAEAETDVEADLLDEGYSAAEFGQEGGDTLGDED
jgi:SMI1 / KNR4 family (SUKH-1)